MPASAWHWTGASVYCTKGHENPDGQTFCGACGEPLRTVAPASAPPAQTEPVAAVGRSGETHTVLLVGFLVCLALAIGFGFVVQVKFSHPYISDCASDDFDCRLGTTSPRVSTEHVNCGSAWLPGDLTPAGQATCNDKGITRNKWISGGFAVLAVVLAYFWDLPRGRRKKIAKAKAKASGSPSDPSPREGWM